MRVSIEKKVWTDSRFLKLSASLGLPICYVVGSVALCWHIAQENDSAELDIDVIDTQTGIKNLAKILVKVGLARYVDSTKNEQIILAGVEERLKKQREVKMKYKDNGKLGGIAKEKNRQKKASESPSESLANGYRNPSEVLPSYSYSNSMNKDKIHSSLRSEAAAQNAHGNKEQMLEIDSEKPKEKKRPRSASQKTSQASLFSDDLNSKEGQKNDVQLPTIPQPKIEKQPTPIYLLVEHWKSDYERIYGTKALKPSRTDFNHAKLILERCEGNIENAKRLVSHFMNRKDAFFLKSGHSLQCLIGSIGKLWAEVNTGKLITNFDAKRAELMEHGTEMVVRPQGPNLLEQFDKAMALAAEEKRERAISGTHQTALHSASHVGKRDPS